VGRQSDAPASGQVNGKLESRVAASKHVWDTHSLSSRISNLVF
jgi:hypothetical protein